MARDKGYLTPFSLEPLKRSCNYSKVVFISYYLRTFAPCQLTGLNKIDCPHKYYFSFRMVEDSGMDHSWIPAASILCCSAHANWSLGSRVNLM